MNHSKEYPRLKRLYNEGRISQGGLQNAVDKGVIRQDEYLEIISENTEN